MSPAEASGAASTPRLPRLSEILGQEPVLAMFRQALSSGKLHHAQLFVGPPGVGKRTTAVALAARLLCRSPIGVDACGDCSACVQVAAGSHPDFRREGFFFDEKKKEARESMVIDQVRRLQGFLGAQAMAGGRKLVLLEEAHALTEEAQNALLKTLEEPPRGSLIVLVCHNASKLQLTVRSRCQRVAFAPLPPTVVERILRDRLSLADEDARFVALHSEGSVAFADEPEALRGAHSRASRLLAEADAQPYGGLVAAAKEILIGTKGIPLDLKVLLDLLRHRLRAQAGIEGSRQLTPPSKTENLADTLRAVDAAYAAVVDLGRNANRRLAAERMWLRISESLD